MKVKDLIKILKKCNSELPVFAFYSDDIYDIEVDSTITDRVDINVIEYQKDDRSRFLCWHCKSELIWGGDHDLQEVVLEEDSEGIISNFSCSNYDCNTHVEVSHFFSSEKGGKK